MADGTSFIQVSTSGGAPEDYLVSGASLLGLQTASATYDGSGAGGDFLPALQILDEVGRVTMTVFGSAVTAGDSAYVTFAPFLRQAAAPASGVSRFAGVYSGDSVTIADGASDSLTWDYFLGGDPTLDISNPIFPQVTKTGNWVFAIDVFCATDLTAGGQFQVEFDVIGLGHGTSVGFPAFATSPAATTAVPSPRLTLVAPGWMDATSATSKLSVTVINHDGAASRDFLLDQAVAVFVGGP